MTKLKYLIICMMGISLVFTSCNKNDKTPLYIPLPVIENYNPSMVEFYYSDSQGLPTINEKAYVVNSISELPEDEFFSNEEFLNQDIDFSKYSLIIFYDLQPGKIKSTKYKWGYSTEFEQYQVSVSYEIEKGSDFVDEGVERITYVRGAMLVNHIQPQPFIGLWISAHWSESE